MTDPQTLSDDVLDFLRRQLELKCTALRLSSTAVGAALYQQFVDRLDQVRAEQERRKC
jgi:hypothetical protein